MAGWHHQLDGREFEWTPEDGDGQGGLACCDSWDRKESDRTERLNWTELIPRMSTWNVYSAAAWKSVIVSIWLMCAQLLSHVWLFVTPWTVACPVALSMESSRQEFWSELPFPTPGDLLSPETETAFLLSPALAGGFFATVPPGKSSLVDQFSSVAESCPTICNPIDCSTTGLPVHHQLLEFIQTHVLWVGDAIQPSHPLSSSSPLAFNLSEHQGLFKWVSSLHQVAEVLSRVLLQHFSNHLWDNWELKTLDCRLNYSSEHLGALNNNCLCIS